MRTLKLSGLASPHMKRRAAPRAYHMPMVCYSLAASPGKRSHAAENPPVLHRPGRSFRARIRAICARLTVSSDITRRAPRAREASHAA